MHENPPKNALALPELSYVTIQVGFRSQAEEYATLQRNMSCKRGTVLHGLALKRVQPSLITCSLFSCLQWLLPLQYVYNTSVYFSYGLIVGKKYW